MPNTARQNFVLKIEQSINLYNTIDKYLNIIHSHCFYTGYSVLVKNLIVKNREISAELEKFKKEVKGEN